MKNDFFDSLRKKAKGYKIEEVIEEYAVEDDALKLVKRKVTKKHIPPDVSAAKMLIDMNSDLSVVTDAEIENKKVKLLEEIKEELRSGNN